MGRALNEMADHLEDLFGEVYEQGVLLRDAEFKLLESQIRPHFIFNVLELINIRCLEAGQNEICHMVSNLAQLLRANITHRHEQPSRSGKSCATSAIIWSCKRSALRTACPIRSIWRTPPSWITICPS